MLSTFVTCVSATLGLVRCHMYHVTACLYVSSGHSARDCNVMFCSEVLCSLLGSILYSSLQCLVGGIFYALLQCLSVTCLKSCSVHVPCLKLLHIMLSVCAWCKTGQKDPGAPQRAAEGKTRTYKTKSETQDKKGIFSTIVLVLLGISVVVPMLQYWGYTSKE